MIDLDARVALERLRQPPAPVGGQAGDQDPPAGLIRDRLGCCQCSYAEFPRITAQVFAEMR